MRPNLSLESIAGALTVLGTSVLMSACGGEAPKPVAPAVTAPEVTPTSGDAKPADAHCGADKAHKEGEAKCAAGKDGAKPTETTPAPGGAATPTDAPKPSSDATDAKPADTTTAAAAPKPAAKKAGKPAGKKGGAASCGAGTCSAKK